MATFEARQAHDRGSRRARWVVLAILLSNVVWPVLLPWRTAAVPRDVLGALWLLGLVLAALALCGVMYAAATAWVSRRRQLRYSFAAVALVLALWLPAFRWARPNEAPWAWLAGLTAGILVLAWPWRVSTMVAGALTLVAALGAATHDGSIPRQVLTLLGAAATIVVMLKVLVWLLRLLEDAETALETRAQLALAEERLRLGRELHDVIGHRLTVIALKAELAGDLSSSDPTRTRHETGEIRALTRTTLEEVRSALHGHTVTNLPEQLRSARLVLDSAAIELSASLDPVPLSAEESRLLAAVLREAITNALRHAHVRKVEITLGESPEGRTFDVISEHESRALATPVGDPDRPGTGLAGLAARCAQLGADLTWDSDSEHRFALHVTLRRAHR